MKSPNYPTVEVAGRRSRSRRFVTSSFIMTIIAGGIVALQGDHTTAVAGIMISLTAIGLGFVVFITDALRRPE